MHNLTMMQEHFLLNVHACSRDGTTVGIDHTVCNQMILAAYVVRASKVRPKDMISKGVSFVAFCTPV